MGLFSPSRPLVTRNIDVNIPDKIFIEKANDPYQYEYSSQEPAVIKHRLDSLLTGFYGRQNFINLFYCLPEIFAPVHEIASRVSDATWQLRKEKDDEIDYSNDDFNRLFAQPNPLLTFKSFVYQSVCYEILTGRNFEYFNQPKTLADDFSSILSWFNLPSPEVRAIMKKGVDPYSATEMKDFVLRYEMPQNSGIRVFDVDRILATVNLNLRTGHDLNDCMSILLGAEKPIKNLIPVYEARGVIYIKRGALGFVVSKKGDASGGTALTPKEKKELRQDFQGTFGVTSGKDTIGITNLPVDFIRTAMSIAELQPFDETLADACAIYAVLRVPPHLIPSKDKSTFNNADADMKAFYTNVIIPMAKRRAEAWTSRFKINRRYIFPDYSHIEVLQENRKEKADVSKTLGDVWLQRWNNGVCTLNDWIADNDGEKGTGPIYEKKIFELTPEEATQVKEVLNLRTPIKNVNTTTPQDTGTQAQG